MRMMQHFHFHQKWPSYIFMFKQSLCITPQFVPVFRMKTCELYKICKISVFSSKTAQQNFIPSKSFTASLLIHVVFRIKLCKLMCSKWPLQREVCLTTQQICQLTVLRGVSMIVEQSIIICSQSISVRTRITCSFSIRSYREFISPDMIPKSIICNQPRQVLLFCIE